MTCAGSGVSAAGSHAKSLAEDLGLIYRGVEHLSMPQNYLMFFIVKDNEENNGFLDRLSQKVLNTFVIILSIIFIILLIVVIGFVIYVSTV